MTGIVTGACESKLTLLCPIKDRPEYTKRFLSYLASESCRFPVLMADGSAKDETKEVADTAISQGLNLEYRKYPFDENWGAFLSKMCHALESIETPYTSLICDDDYYDFDEMANCVRFLEENPKYGSVGGEIIDFHVVGRGGVYGSIAISESGRHCSGRYKRNQQVDDDGLFGRLKRYDDVFPYEYIHRTSTLRDIFQLSKDANVRSYMHLQPIMKYMTLICGPIHYIGTPLILRQDNTAEAEGKDMIRQAASPLYFHGNPDNARTEREIIDRLVRYAVSREPGASEAAVELILQAKLIERYQQAIAQNLHLVIGANRLPVGYLLSQFWRSAASSLRAAVGRTIVGQVLKNVLAELEARNVSATPLHLEFVRDRFLKSVVSSVSRNQ